MTIRPKVCGAKAAVRLIRRQFAAGLDPVSQVVMSSRLDAIDAGLSALEGVISATTGPAPAPAPTVRELEDDVIRAALALRRIRNRLAYFGAGSRAKNQALTAPSLAFDQAVEALAKARGVDR